MSVKLHNDTSNGSVLLKAPDGVGDYTVTLPSGNVTLGTNAQLGVGQTWQDVTGSRVSGTTYTNSTGRPIAVSIFGYNGSLLTVDEIVVQSFNIGNAGATCAFFSIVPNGSTYKFNAYSSYNWRELK